MNYGTALLQLMQEDENVVVMTAENWGPVVPIGLSGNPRFIDTGISEQALVGMAAGLALGGRRPFVHAMAAFLTMRAFEFIRTDIALGKLPVKLVGTSAGLQSGANGPTHQAIEDIALMRSIPNMRIFLPSTQEELVDALPLLNASPDPWYVRYPERSAPLTHSVREGRSSVVGNGTDVALVGHGLLLPEVMDAANRLRERGLGVTVVNLRFARPLDTEALLAAANSARLIVTIEDHLQYGGIGEMLACELARAELRVPHERIALSSWFRPCRVPDAIKKAGMSGEQLAARVIERLRELESKTMSTAFFIAGGNARV